MVYRSCQPGWSVRAKAAAMAPTPPPRMAIFCGELLTASSSGKVGWGAARLGSGRGLPDDPAGVEADVAVQGVGELGDLAVGQAEISLDRVALQRLEGEAVAPGEDRAAAEGCRSNGRLDDCLVAGPIARGGIEDLLEEDDRPAVVDEVEREIGQEFDVRHQGRTAVGEEVAGELSDGVERGEGRRGAWRAPLAANREQAAPPAALVVRAEPLDAVHVEGKARRGAGGRQAEPADLFWEAVDLASLPDRQGAVAEYVGDEPGEPVGVSGSSYAADRRGEDPDRCLDLRQPAHVAVRGIEGDELLGGGGDV